MTSLLVIAMFGFYFGAGLGSYSPALYEYEPYLSTDRIEESTMYTIEMGFGLPLLHLPLSIGTGYFKGKSPTQNYSLLLVPISITLSAASEAVPALVFGEIGVGYEKVYAGFEGNGKNANGWGNSLLLKAGVNIVLTKNLWLDILMKTRDGAVCDVGSSIFNTEENLDLVFSDTYIYFGVRYEIKGGK